MAESASIASHHFTAPDGVDLAWHELGEGKPVVLIHGLFSSAEVNWIKFGHAGKIAAHGYRVIMPDLRGHGDSGKPHDPRFYPPDILARDGLALIAHLRLLSYDLGGYSLGARTGIRMCVDGAAPERLILAGMGLQGLLHTGRRASHFRRILEGLGTFARGTDEWMVEAFLKTTRGDPLALLPLLDSFVDTPAEVIRAITQPTLVVAGGEDDDNGSAQELADLLPDGRYVEVPGGHMSAVTKPEFGTAIADFLSA